MPFKHDIIMNSIDRRIDVLSLSQGLEVSLLLDNNYRRGTMNWWKSISLRIRYIINWYAHKNVTNLAE